MNLPTPPRIAPVSQGEGRPFWSVMIPTYNPADLLEKTLCSVLDQDPGPDRMEIVVDDCSPNGHAEEIVQSLASDRVRFHRGVPIATDTVGNGIKIIRKTQNAKGLRREWSNLPGDIFGIRNR